MDFLRRIEPYQRLTPTPRAFFYFCAPSRLKRGRGAASALPVRMGSCVSLVFVSGPPVLSSKRRAGAIFKIADARAPFPSDPGGRGASFMRKREPGVRGPIPGSQPGTGTRDKDRLIDPMSGIEFARKRARTGFEPLRIANGRQPFMPLRVSHDPCLQNLSLRFAHARRMRPLSVGRLDDAFHPATPHHCGIPGVCKLISLISIIWLIGQGVAGAYRAGGQGAPLISSWGPRPSPGQTAGIDPRTKPLAR